MLNTDHQHRHMCDRHRQQKSHIGVFAWVHTCYIHTEREKESDDQRSLYKHNTMLAHTDVCACACAREDRLVGLWVHTRATCKRHGARTRLLSAAVFRARRSGECLDLLLCVAQCERAQVEHRLPRTHCARPYLCCRPAPRPVQSPGPVVVRRT